MNFKKIILIQIIHWKISSLMQHHFGIIGSSKRFRVMGWQWARNYF